MSEKPKAKPRTKVLGSTAVGAEVEAKCGKCKDITTHIVLAKVGAKPTRVECKTCKATHQYRAARSVAAKKAAEPELPPEEEWKLRMKKARGATVKYDPAGRYDVGVKLNHPKFGEGVVSGLSSGTVCLVCFEERTVKLVMGAANRNPAG